MNEMNMNKYDECNFRKKRTENDYNKNNYLIKDDKLLNILDENNENMNSFFIQSNSAKNKYPDYQSFLQTSPKDNAEIPSIKYYNYIFNIGSPFN